MNYINSYGLQACLEMKNIMEWSRVEDEKEQTYNLSDWMIYQDIISKIGLIDNDSLLQPYEGQKNIILQYIYFLQ